VGVFALFGNPLNAAGAANAMRSFVTDYLLAGGGEGDHPLGFAGITRDIAELAPLPFERTLAGLSGAPLVTLVGLAGLLLLVVRHWRRAAPLLPMLLLGLLAFTSARRFAMYLAPLVGMGLGAWITGAGLLAERLPALRARPRLSVALAPVAALVAIVAVAPITSYGARPNEAAIRTELLDALLALREQLPSGAVVATSWSYGYLVQDVAGAATLNDGEAPDPAVEYLLRRGLVSDDPEFLRSSLGYLEREGRTSLRALFADPARFEDALRTLAAAAPPESPDIYLLFTERSLYEAPVYFRSGLWTPSGGNGPYTGFDLLRCRPGGDGALDCRRPGVRISVDLERGTIDSAPRLSRFVDVRDGEVVSERAYDPAGDLTAQRLGDAVEGSFPMAFADELVYRSNLNQLFLLGRYDASAYEEVFDAFPVARAYRVLPAAR
jgi:dolichyl-diphosphooligosaccharide--protein glycosyltransferase